MKKNSTNKNDTAKHEIFTKTIDRDIKEFILNENSNKTALTNKGIGVIGDSSISASSGLRLLTGNDFQTNSTIPTICQVIRKRKKSRVASLEKLPDQKTFLLSWAMNHGQRPMEIFL